MVLGLCRQLLGDCHHAEDAFQAVFLVLARRARSIRDPDLLGNWLYGVALRTVRKAKGRLIRRRRNEEEAVLRLPESHFVPADHTAIVREQAEALHDEVGRLPVVFRMPVVLCYFEGLSLDEAARRLGCPAGTVHSRLVRARDKLRRGSPGAASSCPPPHSPRSSNPRPCRPPCRPPSHPPCAASQPKPR